MQREKDYLKKRINQLSEALGKLVALTLQTEPPVELEVVYQSFDQILSEQKDFSLRELKEIHHDDLIGQLETTYDFSPNQMQHIADILLFLSNDEQATVEENQDLKKKFMLLYEHIINQGVAISLNKYTLLDDVKNQLK